MQATAVLLIFFGEMFSIIAELTASKRAISDGNLFTVFAQMFLLIVLAGALLIGGYMLGYIYLKNIWVIAAISVASIAIGEPILAYILFQQTPTLGPMLGLGLGILGMVAALVIH